MPSPEKVSFQFMKKIRDRFRKRNALWDTGGPLGVLHPGSRGAWFSDIKIGPWKIRLNVAPRKGKDKLKVGEDLSSAERSFKKISRNINSQYTALTATILWKEWKTYFQEMAEENPEASEEEIPTSPGNLAYYMEPKELYLSEDGSGYISYKEMESVGGHWPKCDFNSEGKIIHVGFEG